MNNTAEQILDTLPATPGEPYGGGYYVGHFLSNGQRYALIVAPKDDGEVADETAWNTGYDDIPGAKSYNDGLGNTQAMAAAGSPLAQWVLGLDINGFTDWYLPSLDELELCYRALKPTTDENSGYARSGINLSATPPTWPYTPDVPQQTPADAFQEGSSEAFEAEWYWSSTQHASSSSLAWSQYFVNGYQLYYNKLSRLRARAVRRIKA